MPDPVGLPFRDWPAADKTMWGTLTTPAGPFDDAGDLADLRPVTLRELRATYGYYLGHLVAQGVDIGREPIEQRVTPKRLRGWILANQDRLAPSSQAVYTGRLLRVHRAAFPDQDFSDHQAASRNLSRRARRQRPHTFCGNQPDAPTLLELGRELIARAETGGGCTSVPDAETWRDGLAILFLTYHPVRARNMAELELGETLRKTSDGYRVAIPGTQTKTSVAIAFDVAAEVGEHLDRYLAEIRPLFPAHSRFRSSLWLTRRGTALAPKGFGRRIGDVTEAGLGVRISPHAFRGISGNTIVLAEEANPGDASALLGHADPRTTRQYYITAGSLEISRRYGKLVNGLLGESRSRQRRRKAAS